MIIGTRPLDGWVIVLAGARNFIGRPVPPPSTEFSPIYELRTIVDPRVGIQRMVVPVLMYAIDRLEMRDAIFPSIKLNDLPIAEVEILSKAVSECEEAMVHLRAHQTGVAKATPAETAKILSAT